MGGCRSSSEELIKKCVIKPNATDLRRDGQGKINIWFYSQNCCDLMNGILSSVNKVKL
jgi:hypothetical protein